MGSSLAAACLVAALVAAEPAAPLQRHEFTRIQMGVPIQISVYAASEEAANTAIRAAYDRIKALNDILSDYDPDSELSQLCKNSGPGRPVAASRELRFVLERSLELSADSDGAFDVTIGPIVRLWRKARRTRQLPAAAELEAALGKVDHRSIRVDSRAKTVELLKPGMQLDLGGIAKGYAADEALKALESHGVSRALVAAAGDIVAGDPPPGETGWRVGIGDLKDPESPPTSFVRLARRAVSTSGDAFQFVEIDGRRYSHLVDPKTGLGLTRRSSVTVLAADGITADSLASALCILGPEKGLELARRKKGLEVLIVEQSPGGETIEHRTPGLSIERASH